MFNWTSNYFTMLPSNSSNRPTPFPLHRLHTKAWRALYLLQIALDVQNIFRSIHKLIWTIRSVTVQSDGIYFIHASSCLCRPVFLLCVLHEFSLIVWIKSSITNRNCVKSVFIPYSSRWKIYKHLENLAKIAILLDEDEAVKKNVEKKHGTMICESKEILRENSKQYMKN